MSTEFREALDMIARDRGMTIDTYEIDDQTGEITIKIRSVRPFECLSSAYIRSQLYMGRTLDSTAQDMIEELYLRTKG